MNFKKRYFLNFFVIVMNNCYSLCTFHNFMNATKFYNLILKLPFIICEQTACY